MKILVVAEGSTEYDDRDGEGVAQILIRRLLGDAAAAELDLPALPYGGRLPRTPDAAAFARDGAQRAAIRAREALRRSCEAIVVVHDADGEADRRREEIAQGLAEADVASVVAIPIEMIEAWLLADPAAFRSAFRRSHQQHVASPEALWGRRDDARSNHPKQVWRRACADVARDGRAGTAAAVAAHLDLDTVAAACPHGFGRFAAELRAAIPSFECVVAADQNRGIGKNNDLPWGRLRGDLRHFRETTTRAPEGKRNAVIMGRRTWDSLPEKQRPLDGRLNIVVSRRDPIVPDGVVVTTSLDHALIAAGRRPDVDRVLVVGGGELFKVAVAHFRCAGVFYTRINSAFTDVDAFFPQLEPRFAPDPRWEIAHHHDGGLDYAIERWIRPRPGT